MLRDFAVTSVLKIYCKIWELCLHQDYDHFVPLTSKQGKFQSQTIATLFLLSLTVVWVEISEKKH